MKVVITTVGTRGDLQPYIALGLGLQQAGYDVLMVSAKNEESFVRQYGLAFYALNVDIQKIMEGGELDEMAKGSNPLKFITGHLKGSKKLKKLMLQTQADIYKACGDADIILFHPGMPLGFFIAKQKNKIAVLATPFPVVATKDYPSILFYTAPRLGRLFNRLTHFIFDKVFWMLGKASIREFWKKNIGTPMDFTTSAIRQQIRSGQPVLNGYSSYLFPPSASWPHNVHTTGSWLLQEENYTPSEDLAQFLDAAEPPVYIGFGSMKNEERFSETLEIIIEALRLTKQQAIVGLGWTKNTYTGTLPSSIFLIDNIPHSWLFLKVKLVIHHGGAGTTAAGLTAGKPTIIIPHNADQPAWGQRVYELGVGAKPIPRKALSANRLATAIHFALQSDIIANAAMLGNKMKEENGVANAVNAINHFAQAKAMSSRQ